MKLTHRLTILYVILSVAPMLLTGYLAYTTGQKILIAEIHEHLQDAAHHKIAAVNFRIADSCRILESLANNPLLIQQLPAIQTGQTAYPWPESYRSILTHHLIPFLSGGHFDEFFIMDPLTSRILISTDPRQEGKLRQFQPYFSEGKHHTHVQNAYFSMSLEAATMVVATPVMDYSGQLLAVMAGRLNMKMLTDIMRQDSPNGRVEDTYLVNRFNFFVTEPWFGKDMALHQTLYNDVINSGLAGQNGISQYRNYRNELVIGMVQWIPEREMCLVTEISHSEAMTPIHRFGQFIFQLALAMAIISAVLVWLIARTLVFPIKQLVEATVRIGSGELDTRIGVRSRDEIGELAGAFNRMAHQLQEILVHRDRLQEEVSKRQETENSLRSSEERHRALLAGTTDLVLLKDNLLRYRLVNPAVGEFFKHPIEFLIGKTDADLLPADAAKQCRKTDEQAIRKQSLVISQETIGDQIFEARKFPVRMPDGTTGVGTFIRDVTENIHNANRIVQLNLVLRALRDLGKVFLLSKTEETLIHDTCDQLISHRRYQGASIILLSETGTPRLWSASGVGDAFEPLAEWLKQGHLPPCCELVFSRREARVIPDKSITCRECPIVTDCQDRQTYCLPLIYNDRIHGSLSITVDLDSDIDDEEKFLLEMAVGDLAYAVYNLRLEQEARLAEDARQKTMAQMQQVQKMEALGTLAGGIAHDFNNILGIIVGYAELAGWQLKGESPLRANLGEILTACQRARDLIAQILTFSRKCDVSRHPVQVHLIIREVLRMLRASLPSTIDIRSRIDSKAVVNADPAQIHQILMNLCTNASHAMQDH
ncbi:MAG: HAMP domain-containing protein, partial [Desulfatirhabdiaceae bacterium]